MCTPCVYFLLGILLYFGIEVKKKKKKNARYVISSKCEVYTEYNLYYNHLVLDCSRCYIEVIITMGVHYQLHVCSLVGC